MPRPRRKRAASRLRVRRTSRLAGETRSASASSRGSRVASAWARCMTGARTDTAATLAAPSMDPNRPTARVTVVVPSWNGREMLDLVLPTLAAQTLGPLRVLVVDNGSADGSAAHVRDRHPAVEVLELAENVGFAAAVNAGIAAADTEYVALFNNDMEIDPGCVAELVAALDAHPEAGSATAKMLMLREPGRLDGAGDELTWWGGAWRRAHGAPDDGRWDRPGPVLSACGGAALYRRRGPHAGGPVPPPFFPLLGGLGWGRRPP